MIDLYFWMTPNGYKVSILLEELALPYRVIPVLIGKGEQFAEDFLRINPNGKIPAITDPNGSDGAPISIFESGAIMIYLANRYGKQFLPDRERDHYAVLQWLMFQMGESAQCSAKPTISASMLPSGSTTLLSATRARRPAFTL